MPAERAIGDEELGELVAAGSLALPKVVGGLEFAEALGFFFGPGAIAREVGVFEFLDGGVDFTELLLRRVGGGREVVDGGVDGCAGPDEFIPLLGPILPFPFPILVGGAVGGVVEEHAVAEAGDGRHELFLGSGRDVMHGELEEDLAGAGGLCFFHLGVCREDGGPGDGGGDLPTLVADEQGMARGLPGVMGLAGVELGLDVPVGWNEVVIVIPEFVAVFDDAADLHVGHAEDFCHVPVTLPFDDEFFVGLAGKGHDRAIGMDGAAGDVADAEGLGAAGGVLELNISELLATFVEHL